MGLNRWNIKRRSCLSDENMWRLLEEIQFEKWANDTGEEWHKLLI